VPDTFGFKSNFGLAVISNFDASSPNHDVIEFDHSERQPENPAALR
jgi:hypothetical protein